MPLSRRRDYDFIDFNYGTPYISTRDLNRSICTTPSDFSMSYRVNMTIHDPENVYSDSSFYGFNERKSKKDRVRSALRELLSRSSRKDFCKSDCSFIPSFRTESPHKRGVSVGHLQPVLQSTDGNFQCFPTYLTPSSAIRGMRMFSRTPSADSTVYFATDDRRRRRKPAPIRINTFAMPEPKVVEKRKGRSKRGRELVGQ